MTFLDFLPCLEAGAAIAIIMTGAVLLVSTLERQKRDRQAKVRPSMTAVESLAENAAAEVLGHLTHLGVGALRLAEAPALKRLGNPLFGTEVHRSIHVASSPIAWIDVAVWKGHGAEPGDEAFYIRYGVPDLRLEGHRPSYSLSLKLRRSSSVARDAIDLRWRDMRSAYWIADYLNRDLPTLEAIRSSLAPADTMRMHPDPARIDRYAPFPHWLISTPFPYQLLRPSLEIGAFTAATWLWLEKLATNLLQMPLTQGAAA